MRIFALGLASRRGGDRARDRWNARAFDPLPSFQELRPLFERELRRARRYERPLSALVLDVARTSDPSRRTDRVLVLGALLQDALRETDLVGHIVETGELVALLPEATAVAAERGAERMHRLWAETDAAPLFVGAATYPADGLTLDELLTGARRAALSVAAQSGASEPRINLAGA